MFQHGVKGIHGHRQNPCSRQLGDDGAFRGAVGEHLQLVQHLSGPQALHHSATTHGLMLHPRGALDQQQQLAAGVARLRDAVTRREHANVGLFRQGVERVGPGAVEEVAGGEHHALFQLRQGGQHQRSLQGEQALGRLPRPGGAFRLLEQRFSSGATPFGVEGQAEGHGGHRHGGQRVVGETLEAREEGCGRQLWSEGAGGWRLLQGFAHGGGQPLPPAVRRDQLQRQARRQGAQPHRQRLRRGAGPQPGQALQNRPPVPFLPLVQLIAEQPHELGVVPQKGVFQGEAGLAEEGQALQQPFRAMGRPFPWREVVQGPGLLAGADRKLPPQGPESRGGRFLCGEGIARRAGHLAAQAQQPLQGAPVAAQPHLLLQAAPAVGIQQFGILHTEFLQQLAMFVVGDAQLPPHPSQHLQAAGGIHIALRQCLPHHPLVGLMPLRVAEARQHPRQHVDLVGVEIAQGPPLQELTHLQPHLLQLPPEAFRQVFPFVKSRAAAPAARQPEGARRHQGGVEEVLHPGGRQQQKGPPREEEEDVEHHNRGGQKHAVADQGGVRFPPLAPCLAPQARLDRPTPEPAQPGAEPQHQRHRHDSRHIDRLAKGKQPGAEQHRQLIGLPGPGAGKVIVPVAGVEVVVEEIAHHQTHVAIAFERERRGAQPRPIHALRVDVDAGLLAGHTGALLLPAGRCGAAHRLGDGRGALVRLAAQQTGRGGIDRLHRRHRAEVLAPGLAAIEPTHRDRRGDGEQQPGRQHEPVGVEKEDAAAEAHE